jgi:hypothetical protein
MGRWHHPSPQRKQGNHGTVASSKPAAQARKSWDGGIIQARSASKEIMGRGIIQARSASKGMRVAATT